MPGSLGHPEEPSPAPAIVGRTQPRRRGMMGVVVPLPPLLLLEPAKQGEAGGPRTCSRPGMGGRARLAKEGGTGPASRGWQPGRAAAPVPSSSRRLPALCPALGRPRRAASPAPAMLLLLLLLLQARLQVSPRPSLGPGKAEADSRPHRPQPAGAKQGAPNTPRFSAAGRCWSARGRRFGDPESFPSWAADARFSPLLHASLTTPGLLPGVHALIYLPEGGEGGVRVPPKEQRDPKESPQGLGGLCQAP